MNRKQLFSAIVVPTITGGRPTLSRWLSTSTVSAIASAVEELPFGCVVAAHHRRLVCVRGLVPPSEPPEQVGAHGVEHVVILQRQVVDDCEPRRRSVDLGHGDGAMQRHDRRWLQREEMVVERADLAPVGVGRRRRVPVYGVDRGLDLIRARRAALQATTHDGVALGDEIGIPSRPVLVGQQHQPFVRRCASRPSRFDQQHKCQQSQHFRFVGHEFGQHAAEADRVRA